MRLKLFIILLCALPSFAVMAQRGKSGNLTVTTANTRVNEYTALTADATAGATSITVANSTLNANNRFPAGLAPGDLIMIIQMQGATALGQLVSNIGYPLDSTWGEITAYNNCGNNEMVQVLSVPNATTINLDCPLKYNYTAAGRTQIVRIPRYNSLTVNSGGVITCDNWNGTIGGICAIEVLGNTTIATGGQINLSFRGFRGGALLENNTQFGVNNVASTSDTYGAEKGEGIVGYQADYDPLGGRYGKGAAGNAGGGGCAHNGGGGGGANGGDPLLWNGHGVPDLSGTNYANAWNQEFPWKSITTSSGGGKGGYTFSSSNQNAMTQPPNTNPWGGDFRNNQGGFGGRPLDYSTGKLFLGGGGGSGDQNDNAGGTGGNGGGMLYLMNYGTVSGGGQIIAYGDSGRQATGPAPVGGWGGKDAAGGGGAGGTIILNSVGAISGISIIANGGKGGNQRLTRGAFYLGNINESEGPGGGGGGGYIAISNGTITRTANGGVNGITNSDALTEFPPNGATQGGTGTTNGSVSNFVIVSNDDTICAGNSTTLTATLNGTVPSGTTVVWYSSLVGGTVIGTGTTYTTPVLNQTDTFYVGTCPGTYHQAVIVHVINSVAVSAGNNVTICQGGSTQLNATGGTVYSWTPATGLSNPAISNPIATPVITTLYSVYVTNAQGCTGMDTVRVTVGTAITVSLGPDPTICQGASANLNAGSSGTSYTWVPATGLNNATISNPTASPTTTTTYTVYVTGSSGCSGTDTITVNVSPSMSISITGNSTVCSGQSTTITSSVSGGTPNYSYSWLPGNQTTSGITVSPVTGTTYTLIASDNAGCTTQQTFTVNVSQPLSAASTVSPANICSGSSATITVTTSGGNGSPTYTWAPSGSGSSSVVSPTSTTTYTITVNDNCNSPVTQVVTVNVSPLPVACLSSSTNSGCVPVCINFTDCSSGNPNTFSWNFGDGSTSVSTSPQHCYNNPGTYSVSLTVSTAQGCSATTVMSSTINVSPQPQAQFTTSPSVLLTAPVSVCMNNSSGNATLYSWLLDSSGIVFGNSSQQNPCFSISYPGTYCITLIAASSSAGCVDSTVSCFTLLSDEFNIEIPNVFTPNGDGQNDMFSVNHKGIKEINIYIFNRWGSKIAEWNSLSGGWDGRNTSGSMSSDGTYYYTLTAIKNSGEVIERKGFVQLLKN